MQSLTIQLEKEMRSAEATIPEMARLRCCTATISSFVGVFLLLGVSTSVKAEESYFLTNGAIIKPLDSFQECDVCPEMVAMPIGSFHMGAVEGESRNPFDLYGEGATGRIREPGEINIIPNEHPRHRVEMDVPFAIGRNEVTVAEWTNCVEAGGCSHIPDHKVLVFRKGRVSLGPDHPVVNVSYFDALTYVRWLNQQVGSDVYRLPTEVEWEYAARAGTETRFAQGDELSSDQANFSRSATEHVRRGRTLPHLAEREMPVPVTALNASNAWALRHMSGNVDEITMSCWSNTHLGFPTSSEYLAHAEAETFPCERRVAKGGSYNTAMDGLRLASRIRPPPTFRRDYLGFRVIRQMSN